MNTQHTPGPWFVDDSQATRLMIRAFCGLSLARVIDGISEETGNANARLIAAAPDLLSALHSAKCALDVFLSGELSEASAVERLARTSVLVDAALAKAGVL